MMKTDAEILLKGRLSGAQKMRLKRLFDMPYKPSELAEEIGFSVRQVYRVYIPAGCPHHRDERNHLWINGKAFREWIAKAYKKRELEKDQAYCPSCKQPVKMIDPVEKQIDNKVYLQCICPICGKKANRFVQRKKRGIW
jgi:hypothetical protein